MINLYIGHDPRESVGTHVFVQSLLATATAPVAIIPLHKPMLSSPTGLEFKDGTNAFTTTRFLIPFLQNWRGMAIFADGADMMMRCDIRRLVALYDPWKAVQVVKHDYKTKSPRKYVGTSMEADNVDYDRKNWASLMMMNCGHYAWRKITPETVSNMPMIDLLQFRFMDNEHIGELPKKWNWLDEYEPNPEAKIMHWTRGVPGFKHYETAPFADEWKEHLSHVNHAAH